MGSRMHSSAKAHGRWPLKWPWTPLKRNGKMMKMCDILCGFILRIIFGYVLIYYVHNIFGSVLRTRSDLQTPHLEVGRGGWDLPKLSIMLFSYHQTSQQRQFIGLWQDFSCLKIIYFGPQNSSRNSSELKRLAFSQAPRKWLRGFWKISVDRKAGTEHPSVGWQLLSQAHITAQTAELTPQTPPSCIFDWALDGAEDDRLKYCLAPRQEYFLSETISILLHLLSELTLLRKPEGAGASLYQQSCLLIFIASLLPEKLF